MIVNKISHHRIQVALFLISTSIIAFQLLLIQIISFVQWYHFAYMIISIALLGFGTAGTIISLFKKKLLQHFDKLLPLLTILTGLSMPTVVYLSQIKFIQFDMTVLFTGDFQIAKLILNYLLFTLPFILGAMVVGIIFTKYTSEIGILYFSNLIGSGFGSVVILFLSEIFFPQKLIFVVAVFATSAGFVSIPKTNTKLFSFLFASLALLIIGFIFPLELKPSEYKNRSKTLNLPDAKLVNQKASPFGIIEAISSRLIRNADGLSLKFQGDVKSGTAVFLNGDFAGAAIKEILTDTNCFVDYSTSYIPFLIGKRDTVLVLNSATGLDIQKSLRAGAKKVIAVEPNSALLNLLQIEKPELNDSIYLRDEVETFNIDSRSFLLSNKGKFNLILLPTIDVFGGSSGVYSLREQYHLTLQAFETIFNRLSEQGAFVVNVWIDYPPRSTIKIISTILEALENNGVKYPSKHIAAIKNWNFLTIIVKSNPLLPAEESLIRSFCDNMQFDLVVLPNLKTNERDRFNKQQTNDFYQAIDKIIESKNEREQLYKNYAFNVSPSSDNKPFFFQFLKLSSLPLLKQVYSNYNISFVELGYIILYFTFIQIFFLSAIFIVLPLFRIGFKSSYKLQILLYFGGIGIGYMFIEIIFIQKFTLYFGNPVYSAAVIICIMLICSGAGSYSTYKLIFLSEKLLVIFTSIIAIVIIQTIIVNEFIYSTIHFPLLTKCILTLIIIFPIAFLMGMPFPIAIKKNNESFPEVIPWAWAINGFASVIAAVLSTIVAVEFGFSIVFWTAAFFYTIAMFSARKLNYL